MDIIRRAPGLFNIKSIYGFSSDNIFAGADNGSVWRYDGNSWKLFARLTKDGHSDIVFDNMWGESQDNFFAFGAYPDSNGLGNNSVIANYENNNWTMLNTVKLEGVVEHLYKNKIDGKIYFRLLKLAIPMTALLFTNIARENMQSFIPLFGTNTGQILT